MSLPAGSAVPAPAAAPWPGVQVRTLPFLVRASPRVRRHDWRTGRCPGYLLVGNKVPLRVVSQLGRTGRPEEYGRMMQDRTIPRPELTRLHAGVLRQTAWHDEVRVLDGASGRHVVGFRQLEDNFRLDVPVFHPFARPGPIVAFRRRYPPTGSADRFRAW